MRLFNKKAVLVSKSKFEITTDIIESCPENSVIVKIAYCGICGSDIPRFFDGMVHFYPLVMGHEFSGEIVLCGASVKKFKKGDRVAGIPLKPCMKCFSCSRGLFQLCKNYSFIGSRVDGALQQYLIIEESNVIKLKDTTDLLAGAFIEPMTVAIHAVEMLDRKVCSNDSIVIFGMGVIGICLALYLKQIGVNNVTVINRSERKKKLCQSFGVNKYYTDAKQLEFEQFDFAFDCTSTGSSISVLLPLMKKRSILQIIGTKTDVCNIDSKVFNLIQRKELILIGSWMSYSNPWPGNEWVKATDILISQGEVLKMLVNKIFPLEQANEAFYASVHEGPKILIKPNA